MIKKLLFSILLVVSSFGYSQINGTVTNAQNEPLPYVNIYLKNANTGTTSNGDGVYNLNVDKLGKHVVTFQFLGYTTQDIEIDIKKFPFTLNALLTEETTSLDEVVLNSKTNPADRIIREVIKSKPQILDKQRAYTADFYSRGLWRVENAPEKFFGQEIGDLGGGLDSTRTGIVYLSETISKIAYKAPDDFKEVITASKVSGDSNGFSFNSAQEADFSFYNNTLEIQAQLVSPIADNAFNYYTYKLIGTFKTDNKLINKIQVTPKRKNDRVFEGLLYVVEDDWQLYGVELTTTGSAIQVPFVESLVFKHNFKYDEIQELWVKISQSIDFSFKLFGFGGNGRFSAVYSNYDFNPKFDRTSFTNEVLSFKPEANTKDSAFWQQIRPIPLTSAERQDYVIKDSLQEKRDSKPYKDSVDIAHNKFRLGDILMGYSFQNTYDRWRLSYDPVLTSVAFNTIQGFNASAGINYSTWTENYKQATNVSLAANYGLDEERLRVTGRFAKRFDRIKNTTLALVAGTQTQQFNSEQPISTLENSFATLIWKKNYAKFYELDFARLTFSQEVVNGLQLTVQAGYEKRSPLFNTTDQTFFDWDFPYTSNNPLNPQDFTNPSFETHSLAKFNLQAVVNFDQKYMSYPDGKFKVDDSKYPTLYLTAEQTLGATNSDYNFTELKAEIRQELTLGNKGDFGYAVTGGTFLNAENISFVDYQHFNGNQTFVNLRNQRLTGFNAMPYYDFSTNNRFLEAHIEHNFKGFILGKVPALRALNLNLVTGVHTLLTNENKPYTEFNIGVDNLGFGKLKFLRVDYVRSFNGPNKEGTFVFGISF